MFLFFLGQSYLAFGFLPKPRPVRQAFFKFFIILLRLIKSKARRHALLIKVVTKLRLASDYLWPLLMSLSARNRFLT